jgi:PAS domain S-box-containing protein
VCAAKVRKSKILPFGPGLESLVLHHDGTEFPVAIELGLIEAGPHTLISGTIQKVQHDRGGEYLRTLVEASDDAIVGLDLDGTIISWNKGAEKIYGYKAEEVLGQSVAVLIPPGYPNELPGIMKRLQRGEHIEKYETKRVHKDGHAIDVSITISPVTRKGGIVVGASVVARDITEYREAQSTILGLRALVEASDDAIIGKTMDGTIISWNKGAEKIYGYKAEEVLGQSVAVLIPPDHPNELPGIMKRLQSGEHIEKYETKRIRKDGHQIDVSITISPVARQDGLIVGASVVARDITLQKEADQALHLSHERFRVALKNAPVVVFSQDTQLRYTWINSPSLGLAREDFIDHTDAEMFPGEEGARLTAIKQQVLRTGIEAHDEITVTLGGEKHHFKLAVEPICNLGGTVVGLLCSAVDITGLKETITKLQQALDEVQALRGFLPICASCKKIKDEREEWQVMEVYVQAHSGAKFSHGICPECMRKLYPDYSSG